MNRFRWWFANFMQGRYGTDQLNRFLLIAALALIIVDFFVSWRLLNLVIVVILIFVYCRMFSRNVNARYRENQKFLELTDRFRARADKGGRSAPGFTVVKDDTHKILRCPSCGERLRVPKGAGNIMISCPHCHTKFRKKV